MTFLMFSPLSRRFLFYVNLSTILFSTTLEAQIRPISAPNSGQILQQLSPSNTHPPATQLDLNVEKQSNNSADDTTRFTVHHIEITGNTRFAIDKLHALVVSSEGKELTLNDLNTLADRITAYYHQHGYPLSSAYVPAQSIKNGVVNLVVVEARYGKIVMNNTSTVSDRPLHATLAPLKPGDDVSNARLERSLLLLSDISGVTTNSTLRPGEEVSTSDLLVDVAPAARYTGTAGVDNFGSRYTDALRGNASFNINSPFHQGDLFDINMITSGSGLKYGHADYRYLLNGQGTTLGASISGLDYRLKNDLSDLDGHGSAQVGSLLLSHPFIRHTSDNLYGQIEYDHRRLRDQLGLIGLDTHRHSNSWTITLAGDQRDDSGITNARISTTHGRLYFDNFQSLIIDYIGANTGGSYTKWTASLSRLQQINPTNAFYLGFSGQWSNKNLDTSEQFYLGGPDTVRGYDVGVLAGAQGTLATLEFRHDMRFAWAPGAWQAVVFVDSGHVEPYKNAFIYGSNSARINSGGTGLHWSAPGGWMLDTSLATPIGNKPSLLGPSVRTSPRFWVQAQKAFML